MEFDQRFGSLPIRWLEPRDAGLMSVISEAARAACSPLLCTLFPGQTLSSDSLLTILRNFSARDSLAMGLPAVSSPHLVDHLFGPPKNRVQLQIDKIAAVPLVQTPFVIRTLAMRELSPFVIGGRHDLVVTQLILWCLGSSWAVLPLENVAFEGSAPSSLLSPPELEQLFAYQILALTLAGIADRYEAEPFSAERVRMKQTLELDPAVVEQMRWLRGTTPTDWQSYFELTSFEKLAQALTDAPEWPVGRQLLRQRSP